MYLKSCLVIGEVRNADLKEGYEKEINQQRKDLEEARSELEGWYARKMEEDAIAAGRLNFTWLKNYTHACSTSELCC